MKKVSLLILLSFALFFSINIKDTLAASSSNQFIVINKESNKLAFFENGKLIKVYPVATGKTPSLTPEGKFKIVNKIKNRPYYKGNIPGGSPKNPLGDRWMGLNARGTQGTTYAIHGNNNEDSIGKYVSAGCVRMHNKDVRELFDKVIIDASVVITTSSKSFEDIAKSNGYEFGPEIVKFEKNITFFKQVNLYKEPNTKTYLGSKLNPQNIQTYEKAGNFIKVQTWNGYAWAYIDEYIEGKPTELNTYITTFEHTPMQNTPGTKPYSTLSPQKLYAYEKIGSFYKVKTWLGSYYIKTDKVIEAVIEPYEGTVVMYERKAAYNQLFGSVVTSFAPQELEAFEKIGRYYRVNTYLGPLWIYH